LLLICSGVLSWPNSPALFPTAGFTNSPITLALNTRRPVFPRLKGRGRIEALVMELLGL